MANCYECGEPGAEYRRTVHTGSSKSTSYGRSVRTSFRNSYGTRSVCERCAADCDKDFQKSAAFRNLVISFLLAVVILFFK